MNILIVNAAITEFDETSLMTGGLGGSETWSIQLANAFIKKGCGVTVISNCKTHTAPNGVIYVSQNEFYDIITKRHYDLCIVSRCYSTLISEIENYKTCSNVFIQAHDENIYGESVDNLLSLNCFKGVATLSAYQELSIYEKSGLPWRYMTRIENGIDPELFKDINYTPQTQRLLFSSDYSRGGDIIINYITPCLNNIGVDFCSYINKNISYDGNVSFIGSLDKLSLYTEMGKRYCWFYPSIFNETFCITLLENIMCENDLILPLTFGMSSVLEPFYKDVSMTHTFNSTQDEFSLAVDEAVEKINLSITNHEKGAELRKELKNYVLNKYTWDLIADKWLKMI